MQVRIYIPIKTFANFGNKKDFCLMEFISLGYLSASSIYINNFDNLVSANNADSACLNLQRT
jgi:hypothetical protein